VSRTRPAKPAILTTGTLLFSLLASGCGGGNAQLPSASAGVAASAPVARAAPLADFVVDVSQLQGGLGRLPVDERGEQVADWAVAGSLAQLVREQPEALPALGRLPPLRRDPRYEVLGIHDYGHARRVIVDANHVLLVLPADEPHRDVILGRLADQARADLGHIPANFAVYLYGYDPASGRLRTKVDRTLTGEALFSPTFGYIEAAIRNEAELSRWLKETETLSHFAGKDDGIVLGGRAAGATATSRLQVEDVAALYQAYLAEQSHIRGLQRLDRDQEMIVEAFNRLAATVKSNVDRYNQRGTPDCEEFDRALRVLGRLFGDPEAPGPISCQASPLEIIKAEVALVDRLSPWTKQVLEAHAAEFKRVADSAPPAHALGFSLDPQWEIKALGRDLDQLKKDPQPILDQARILAAKADAKTGRGADYPTQTAVFLVDTLRRAGFAGVSPLTGSVATALDQIMAEARAQKSATVEHLVSFERLVASLSATKEREAQVLVALLRYVEARDRIQCARYDGALAGTRVGMGLFYTDLSAKLWAGLDYQGSAPAQALPGMVTLWSAEGAGEHSTRIWFGPRSDRMARLPDLSEMYFAPIATRIFSASSTALDPGHEETPADPVRHVLDWWTHHYAELARHDPKFAFVNEVQKWSALTSLWVLWDALPELERERVGHRLLFDRWSSSEPGVRIPVGVRLLPRARWVARDPSWECMDQLASAKEDPVRRWTIAGGHSLADYSSPRLLAPASGSITESGPPGIVRAGGRIDDNHAWDHSASSAVAGNSKTTQHAAHSSTTSREGNVITTVHSAPGGSVDVSRFELSDSGPILYAPNPDTSSQYVRGHKAFMAADFAKAMVHSAEAQAAQPDSHTIRMRSPHSGRGGDEPPGSVRLAFTQSWRERIRQPLDKDRESTQSAPPARIQSAPPVTPHPAPLHDSPNRKPTSPDRPQQPPN
jgi:hypothetical protein